MATRPEVLERISALCSRLGISEKAFLETALVRPTFLSRAKAGGCNHSKSEESWSRILSTLEALEKTESLRAVAGQSRLKASEVAKPASVTDELVESIQRASTLEKLQALNQTVMEYVARQFVDANMGRVLSDLISRQQQILKLRIVEEEKARAGQALEIIVKEEFNWRQAGPCPTCGGSGFLE